MEDRNERGEPDPCSVSPLKPDWMRLYAGCKQMEEKQWWQWEARLCYIEAVRILSLGLVKEDEWINEWVEGGKEMCWLHEKYEEGRNHTFN